MAESKYVQAQGHVQQLERALAEAEEGDLSSHAGHHPHTCVTSAGSEDDSGMDRDNTLTSSQAAQHPTPSIAGCRIQSTQVLPPPGTSLCPAVPLLGTPFPGSTDLAPLGTPPLSPLCPAKPHVLHHYPH